MTTKHSVYCEMALYIDTLFTTATSPTAETSWGSLHLEHAPLPEVLKQASAQLHGHRSLPIAIEEILDALSSVFESKQRSTADSQ